MSDRPTVSEFDTSVRRRAPLRTLSLHVSLTVTEPPGFRHNVRRPRTYGVLIGGQGMARRLITAFIVLLGSLNAAAQTDITGKWIGEGGSVEDRITIGLQFKPAADGKLEGSMFLPVLNIYDSPLTVERQGDSYKIPKVGMELELKGGKLSGIFGRRKLPITFTRTDTLPSDPPIPNVPKGPEPIWKTKLGGTVYASVAVRDGIAYIGTTGGVFNAVRVKDGTYAWTFNAGRPMHGEALTTADAVYFVCDNGFLFKLDRATGKENWRYDLGDVLVPRILGHPAVFEWDYLGPRPSIAEDVVYVGSGDGSLHAVEASSGKRVWRFKTRGKLRSDALVEGSRIFIGSLDGNLYAVDRKSGNQVWKQDTGAPVTSSPALIGGAVIVGNRGAGLIAFNPEDGAIRWRAPFWGSWVESTAVPYENLFYIGASDSRRVTCYDPKDGRVVWRTDVFGWNWGKPAVTDKRIYLGVAGGTPYTIRHVPSLTALDRKTGKIVWRWTPRENDALQYGFPAGPVVEGNVLVIAAIDGMLYGFPVTG